MSADGKPARGRTRILTDSTRKRNRKEALAKYNYTRNLIISVNLCLKVHIVKINMWTKKSPKSTTL
jgi:hypothetical protein